MPYFAIMTSASAGAFTVNSICRPELFTQEIYEKLFSVGVRQEVFLDFLIFCVFRMYGNVSLSAPA